MTANNAKARGALIMSLLEELYMEKGGLSLPTPTRALEQVGRGQWRQRAVASRREIGGDWN
jgi:hypothetical protein